MRMTPEQKAFYEYGEAREALRRTIIRIRENSFPVFGDPYRRLIKREREYMCVGMDLRKYVHNVRQKRAVCRRTCGQCAHFSPDEWGPRKDGCLKRYCAVKNNRFAGGCKYWTPRKEGE